MIYPEEKPNGLMFPIVAILLAMAGMVAALIINQDGRDLYGGGRVWLPQQIEAQKVLK